MLKLGLRNVLAKAAVSKTGIKVFFPVLLPFVWIMGIFMFQGNCFWLSGLLINSPNKKDIFRTNADMDSQVHNSPCAQGNFFTQTFHSNSVCMKELDYCKLNNHDAVPEGAFVYQIPIHLLRMPTCQNKFHSCSKDNPSSAGKIYSFDRMTRQ